MGRSLGSGVASYVTGHDSVLSGYAPAQAIIQFLQR